MRDKLYIDGKWQEPSELAYLDVYDPYREAILHRVSAGSAIDVDLFTRHCEQVTCAL
jgi:hypothetical protein